jgi:DNA polymerase-1
MEEINIICQKCPLKGKKPVFGRGPYNAKLIIVGEAPGEQEEKQGIPFIGKSGQLLDGLLSKVGINRDECFITNVVACRPTDDKGNNISPSSDMIKCCEVRLNRELDKVKAKLVLLLGNTAIKKFLGVRYNLQNSEGIPFKQNGRIYVPTYHPAALLRDPSKIKIVEQTLEKVVNWLDKDPYDWSFEEYKLLFDKNGILKYLDLLSTKPLWCCDIETSDITFDSVIFTIAFSSGDLTFGFPFRKPDGSMYWSDQDFDTIVSKLKEVFANDSGKVFHNALFDLTFLKKELGIECKNLCGDTLIMAYLLDENAQRYGLKSIVWKYLGKGGYESDYTALADEDRPGGVDTTVVLKYNCADAHATYLLYQKLIELLPDNLKKLHLKLNIPTIYMLVDTRVKGIKVDIDYVKKLTDKFNQDLVDIESRIYEMAGETFNVNSTRDLSRILYQKLKLPVFYKTEKGNPATDTFTLENLRNYHPIINLILDYRKKKKLLSTYFVNFIELCDSNGRLHTDYSLTGTRTGRLSSRNPNLQNIPREEEVQDIFVAGNGCFFAHIDFKQAELRAFCHYAKDDKLKEAFESGFDPLKTIASLVFKIPIEEVDEERRRLAKFVVYGLLYGRRAKSIAEEHKMSIEEAQKIIDSFFDSFPKSKQFYKEVIELAKQQGYLQNFFGRVRRFPGINSSDFEVRSAEERQALNFLPQSTVADYTMYKGSLVYEKTKHLGCRLVLTVHDSLTYEIPEDKGEEVLQIMFRILGAKMKGFFTDIPFDCEVGYRLGSCVQITDPSQLKEKLKEAAEYERSKGFSR